MSDVQATNIPARLYIRYSAAIVAVAIAFFLHFLLEQLFGKSFPPYIAFYPAVLTVAIIAGLWPGVVATVLAAMVVDYAVLPPRGSFTIASTMDAVALTIFVGMGVFMSLVAEASRRNQQKAATFERELALRDKHEKLLQASEAIKRQADMLRLSFDAIIVWRLGGTIESWNRGAEQLYGYSEGEALGAVTHKLLKTTHSLPWPEIEAELRERGNWDGELRHVTKDGRELTVSARHQLIVGADGVERVLETNRDITEHKRIDNALHESEERLRLLGDNLPDSAVYQYVHGTDGRVQFQYFSAGVERLNGVTVQEVLRDADTLHRQFPPEYLDQLVEAEARSVRDLSDFDMELPMRRPDGQVRWMRLHSRPRVLPDGSVVWDGVQTDITELKRAEQSLREREALLQEVGRMANVGGWEFDPATGQGSWTEQVAHIHDLDPNLRITAALGKTFYPGTSRTLIETALREAVEQAKPYDLELEFTSAKGIHKWVRTTGHPVVEDGKVVKIRGSIQDISERKQAECVLQTTLQRFYLILSNMYSGVLLVTDEGRIEFANQAFCDRFGFDESPAELTGLDQDAVLNKIRNAYRYPDQALARIREVVGRAKPVAGEELAMQNDRTFLRDFIPLKVDGKSYGRLWLHTDITGRKQAEEGLRLSEEKLAKAFATNPAAIVITRLADGVFLDVNEAFATMFGYSREEAVGNSAAQFWPALENRAQRVQQLLEKGSYTGQEQMMRRRSGEQFVALGSAATLEVAGERLIISTWLDIGARKKAESRLRRFYETDLFAILYWSIDGGVIDVNDSFLTMTGYTREDLLAGSLNWSQMTPPEYQALDEDARRQIRETGVHLPYEKEFIRKDGTRVWGLFSAAAWEDNRDEGVSFILDITQRKRAEDALRESEERWATTLQSIGDAVISTDSAGKIRFMNEVAQRLTGWSLSDAKDLDLSEVFNIVHEETRIKPESPVAKVLRSGQIVGLANHTALIRRDGTEIPIEDSAAPIWSRSGQIEGVVLVFHDVLEQRSAERALRISDRLATTGRLAATIAHEIHNPLDAIANLLYLIDQDTQEDSTREFTTMASRELVRVTQMTRRMLAFQRESAKPTPVEIREILGTVIELYERKLKAEGVQLEQQIEIDGQVLALPGELRQMFANLVGNAIEAVAPRKGKITLRAYASRDWKSQRSGIRVVVADNGPGIPADVRPRILEPFFTTKGESGTGLGLWIASDILRKYDGVMKLRTSTQPRCSGTCFSIFLPLQIDNAAVRTTPASAAGTK